MWKKFVWNLCKCIKNKKGGSHVHKCSQPLLNILWKQNIVTPITASNLFGYDATSFDRLLLTSSPLKLFQVGWGQTHIFRLLQKYLIGFKLRLWLGHSELPISHSFCVFRFIVLLEGEPSARLRFWMLWTGFSLRLSQYFGALSFSSTLMCPSVLVTEKQHHSMRLLPAHFIFGLVLCRWWAELVSFKHDA